MRGLRSVSQGALVVDFSLYLRALGWSAVAISEVLGGSLLLGAALTLAVGPLSDRLGRRGFLIAWEVLQAGAALIALATAWPAAVGGAAVVAGFGRGANGAAGPFAPVEQAWLAHASSAVQRGRIFSLNAAVGFFGMAAGALLGALPPSLDRALGAPAGDRFPFLLAVMAALGCLGLLHGTVDSPATNASGRQRNAPVPADAAERRAENRRLLHLGAANALNGLGIGMTGPLIAYWFAVRFGRGPEAIGPLLATSFALAGFGSLGAGRLTERLGLVRTVVRMRIVGVLLMLAIPFAPSFLLAAGLYVVRAVLNQSTVGARSALSVSLVRQERRGLAATTGNVALQIPRALGPVIAGVLIQAGMLGAPFILGAALQAAYIYVFDRSFGTFGQAARPD